MITPADRDGLQVMLDDLAQRQAAAQAAVRTWRNFTLGVALVLLVLMPLFAILAPHLGGSLVTIRREEGGSATTTALSTGDLAAIELWGSLGGVVGVLAALSGFSLTAVPSSLQVVQLLLKPVAGAAFAVFGIVLTQGGLFAQLQPVSSGAIAAYAALFGFAQQLLTRLIDRRIADVSDTAAHTPPP